MFDLQALETCFEHPKIQASFESLYHCLGFITAMASCPEEVAPSEWVDELMLSEDKEPHFDSEEQVKVFTTNLISWWSQCAQIFDRGETISLPDHMGLSSAGIPNSELIKFSEGYLDGFDWLYETWQVFLPKDDQEALRTISVLNFILARFVDEQNIKQMEPDLYEQMPDTHGCFNVLAKLISGVGMLGHDLAVVHKEAAKSAGTPLGSESMEKNLPFKNMQKSVGRNDDCPCGSGKKFKKCCLH